MANYVTDSQTILSREHLIPPSTTQPPGVPGQWIATQQEVDQCLASQTTVARVVETNVHARRASQGIHHRPQVQWPWGHGAMGPWGHGDAWKNVVHFGLGWLWMAMDGYGWLRSNMTHFGSNRSFFQFYVRGAGVWIEHEVDAGSPKQVMNSSFSVTRLTSRVSLRDPSLISARRNLQILRKSCQRHKIMPFSYAGQMK